jgi:predicted 3-demethylubiquinone-9 3-methyltransferase (glyoxalase superfamily)
MPKISPFLWFNNQAEEAANFYVSVFKNSRIVRKTRYGDSGPGPKGSIKYGLSWQIVPTVLSDMLSDPDPAKSDRVMKAVLKMKKLDIATLKRAYENQ